MTRTTLDLDPTIVRELRRRGRRERKSMGRLASELLARALAEPDKDAAPPPFSWISRDLGKPKVELEDKEAAKRMLQYEHATRATASGSAG